MTPQSNKRLFRASAADQDPARRYVLLALLQAEQDKPREIVLGKLCSSCEPSIYWRIDGGICSLAMPAGLGGSQVREALESMAGFDKMEGFPKQSDLLVEVGESRMDWVVILAGPESQVILRRKS
jgi:hypothetical protein